MRRWIEAGHLKANAPLNENDIEALNTLDQILDDPNVIKKIATKKFEIIFLNNKTVVHTRNPFTNSENEDEKRHMVRVWIRENVDAAYNKY